MVHQTIVLTPRLADFESSKSIAEHDNDVALQKLKALVEELIPPNVKVSYYVSESNLQLTLPELLTEPYENLIFVGLKGTGF